MSLKNKFRSSFYHLVDVCYLKLLLDRRYMSHVQYCDIMRFTVLHNRHHEVSQSVPFFMHCKTFSILLRVRVRGHFVMSITKNHESHYVTALDNPRIGLQFFITPMLAVSRSFCLHEYDYIKKKITGYIFQFFFFKINLFFSQVYLLLGYQFLLSRHKYIVLVPVTFSSVCTLYVSRIVVT